jgi:hypothetical protein
MHLLEIAVLDRMCPVTVQVVRGERGADQKVCTRSKPSRNRLPRVGHYFGISEKNQDSVVHSPHCRYSKSFLSLADSQSQLL